MRVAVVSFPGSNCDEDALHVAGEIVGADAKLVWHKERALPPGTDLVILPGGFSYGDALRSGALARFSPVMEAVRAHADAGGYVLGICNGFQILLEAGLLEGAMLQNANRKFINKRVKLDVRTTHTPFTEGLLLSRPLEMPIAHHEGCYHASPEMRRRLWDEDRVVFTYSGENPNGAMDAIAGIVNEKRNVLGLMPHPERAAEPSLGGTDGLGIFTAIARRIDARSRS